MSYVNVFVIELVDGEVNKIPHVRMLLIIPHGFHASH